MARRTTPKNVQKSTLLSSRRRCCVCYGLHKDLTIKQGQLAHLDHDARNNDESNLVFLCLEHHDQYDSVTSQSKGMTAEEVRHFRHELQVTLRALTPSEHDTLALAVVPNRTGVRPRPSYPGFFGVERLRSDEPRVFLRESPTAIARALRALPPLSRDAAAKAAYCGRWVTWCGKVGSINEDSSCYRVGVVMEDEEIALGIVMLIYPLSWSADVEVLREDDRICFEAQILSAADVINLVHPVIVKHLRPE